MDKKIQQRLKQLDYQNAKMMSEFARSYSKVSRRLLNELEALYETMLLSDEVPISYLYKYDRYFKIVSDIQDEMNRLTGENEQAFSTNLVEMYEKNAKLVSNQYGFAYNGLPYEQIEEVCNRIWCADNLNWSQRLWRNKALLVDNIRDYLVDAATTGRPPSEWATQQALQKFKDTTSQEFRTYYNNYKRLATTELAHVRNLSDIETYLSWGVINVRYHTLKDFKVCDKPPYNCKASEGVIYHIINDADKLPPRHPYCQCYIEPIFNN